MPTTQNPFTEKSQNIVNAANKAPRATGYQSINPIKLMITQRQFNSTIMYNTNNDNFRATRKPEKENSTHVFSLPFSKRNSGAIQKNRSGFNQTSMFSSRDPINFHQTITTDNYKSKRIGSYNNSMSRVTSQN